MLYDLLDIYLRKKTAMENDSSLYSKPSQSATGGDYEDHRWEVTLPLANYYL